MSFHPTLNDKSYSAKLAKSNYSGLRASDRTQQGKDRGCTNTTAMCAHSASDYFRNYVEPTRHSVNFNEERRGLGSKRQQRAALLIAILLLLLLLLRALGSLSQQSGHRGGGLRPVGGALAAAVSSPFKSKKAALQGERK